MKMEIFVLLFMLAHASEQRENDTESFVKSEQRIEENSGENSITVKIEEDEYIKENKFAKKHASEYIGITYNKDKGKWLAQRRNKNEKKTVYNGLYKDEVLAAHASDTLARKLIANGEQNQKLNFPDDYTEVYPDKKQTSSTYIGVNFYEKMKAWQARRRSKKEKEMVHNGFYKDEKTAAQASDTLARKLMAKGEYGHKLNFPDDYTEVYTEKKPKSSKYLGVCYTEARWLAYRRSKKKNQLVHNGSYKDERTAAHASDTLARYLMKNGEYGHKLNFPENDTEEQQRNKRKRSDHEDLGQFKTNDVSSKRLLLNK